MQELAQSLLDAFHKLFLTLFSDNSDIAQDNLLTVDQAWVIAKYHERLKDLISWNGVIGCELLRGSDDLFRACISHVSSSETYKYYIAYEANLKHPKPNPRKGKRKLLVQWRKR